MIAFENVWFSYTDPAGNRKPASRQVGDHFAASLPFCGLSFHVHPGQRVAIRGPSGCGKTTLLRLILGLEKPDAGKITVQTRQVSAHFQEDRLLPFRTVAQNCALFCPDRPAIAETLRALGLEQAADAYPSALSGGMARRASLARALAHRADLYVFDEPFNGLDKASTQHCAETINRVTAGKTVLLVSHSADDAAALRCDLTLESLMRG